VPGIHTESAFESTLVDWLLEHGGYAAGEVSGFDRERALFADELLSFIRATQPERWQALEKQHGDNLGRGLVDQLVKDLHKRGTLDVLRHGFKFYGDKIEAAYFKPAHRLNPELEQKSALNRLTVTRQVHFDPKSESSVDLLVALNGLPIATFELKNELTGQNVNDAVRQYMNDRDPKLVLFQFKRGAIVHFAVDAAQVFMTTRLSGKQTMFLPFNQGTNGAGNAGGAGNPPTKDGSYRTSYLWRDVLTRERLLDIVARYVHLLSEEKREGGRTVTKESMVFPRYHQLDVVTKLVAAAANEGSGHHYLVQHSAGSGKSNSIAWLAHRLSSLHDAADRKVFDSVVVITDRTVLDKQLQDTIYQFEHAQGVVARIDKNSAQLSDELVKGTPIIITTLQKFPFVTEEIARLPKRRYALIVDEAHSSQSGESARELRSRLGTGGNSEAVIPMAADNRAFTYDAHSSDEDEPTHEDVINAAMASRGRQPNLSFFAFTATPKAKTLEVFGRPGPEGNPHPFHVYGMRQAIEERFILDVLKGYATYQTYYRLVKRSGEDPEVQRSEARAALARFVSLHHHNIAQKTEVMIEHFRAHTRKKIYGRAKAMVVTRSRLHAVRYKKAFDRYLADKNYVDMKALVAFSGTVKDDDDGQEYTEVGMNEGLKEKELPERFASSDYQVLLVANKYQTGFDQPLLHTMYVDRKLSGVQAVQTLSRLNRMCPGKEDTFVLDFANDATEIQAAFQPFYETTTVAEQADPQQLHDLQHDLDSAQIYQTDEVEAFARAFYVAQPTKKQANNELLYRHLDPALERYRAWDDEEARDAWRGQLQAFVRLYSFLSQVMPYPDRDLEVRYSFGRFLLKRLPRSKDARFELDGEAELEYYRLTRVGETDIELIANQPGEVRGPTSVGTRTATDELVTLSSIIDRLNELFDTDFSENDRLFLDHMVEAGKAVQAVQERATANTYENFALSIREMLQNLMVDGLEKHEQLATRYLNDPEFKREIDKTVAQRIYDDLRRTG
jgi:type I restriction enzyme, R subunit